MIVHRMMLFPGQKFFFFLLVNQQKIYSLNKNIPIRSLLSELIEYIQKLSWGWGKFRYLIENLLFFVKYLWRQWSSILVLSFFRSRIEDHALHKYLIKSKRFFWPKQIFFRSLVSIVYHPLQNYSRNVAIVYLSCYKF